VKLLNQTVACWSDLSRHEREVRIGVQSANEEQAFLDAEGKYLQERLRSADTGRPEQQLINDMLDRVIEEIGAARQYVLEKARVKTQADMCLLAVPIEDLAHIAIAGAIQGCVEGYFTGSDASVGRVGATAQGVVNRIGHSMVMLIAFRDAREGNREAWTRKDHFEQWTPKRIRSFAERFTSIPASELDHLFAISVGHALLEALVRAGMLDYQNTRRGKVQVVTVSMSPGIVERLREEHGDLIARISFPRRPLLCPPVPHSKEANGGYITTWLRKPVVRGAGYSRDWDSGGIDFSGSIPSGDSFKALNALQGTEWRINTRVLDVMQILWRSGVPVCNLPPHSMEAPRFEEEPEDASDDELLKFRRSQVRQRRQYARSSMQSLRLAARISLANEMRNTSFWHGWNFCFRGRMYPQCELLSPQGQDQDKGLLLFANPAKRTEVAVYWLKVQLAGHFGVGGKGVSFDDRVAWVDSQAERWAAVNDDPIGNLRFWADSSKFKNASFSRLACIFELQRDDGLIGLPVQNDGACNGLQHWAAVMRDQTLASSVNLIDGDSPADLYGRVAEKMTDLCVISDDGWRVRFMERWAAGIPRKVPKRAVMIIPYSGTESGVRGYLLDEGHFDWCGEEEVEAVGEATKLVFEAMDGEMGSAMRGMKYLQKAAHIAYEKGTHAEWATPSGFIVKQRYFEREIFHSMVDTIVRDPDGEKVKGRKKLSFGTLPKKIPLLSKSKSGIAPNFIHSLDASHAALTINRMYDAGIRNFCFIHDSFGTDAGKVPIMRVICQEEFAKTHALLALDTFQIYMNEHIGEDLIPCPPRVGSYDISDATSSTYIFS